MLGISTVTLSCSLESYTAMTAASSTFTLTITKDCVTGNAIILPASNNLSIIQTSAAITFPAFGDTTSASSNPPTCGPRTCTSNDFNVIWDYATQLFTLLYSSSNTPNTSRIIQLACSLSNYPSVPLATQSFTLSLIGDCIIGNTMTIPTLPAVSIGETYIATTIPAFGDAISGSTVPQTCGLRTCTSSSPNVVWNHTNQLFTV